MISALIILVQSTQIAFLNYFKTSFISVFILLVQIGIQIGWASPNLSRLTAKDSNIPLTPEEASWVVSILSLGSILGALIGSVSNEYVGTRKTILVAFFCVFVSWASFIAADSVTWLYFGRAIGGVSCLMTYTSFSLYLGEVARPEIRGTLISVAATGSLLGTVVGTVAESYLPMKLSSSIYLVTCSLGIFTMLYLHDSPYHLVKNKNLDKAKKSIIMYNAHCDVDKELAAIENYLNSGVTPLGLKNKLGVFKNRPVRKALILVIVLFSLPHVSGEIAIMSYLETILINAKASLIDPKQFVIYTHVTGIVTCFLTVNLTDKFGRRVMLMISSVGVSVAIGSLGTYFYFLHSGINMQPVQWLPFVCVIMYRITHAFGYAQIPSTVLGEILPENIRSFGVCIACLGGSLASFIFSKIYQTVVDLAGEECIMWIFAGFSLSSVPFTLFFLPETKGKTFQEIQDLLKK